MELRRTLTGGLAWAGLVIVVAVPTVEAVRSKLVPDGADAVPTVAEIEAPTPASAVPTVVAPAAAVIVAKKPAEVAVPQPIVAAAPPAAGPAVHDLPAVASPVVQQAPPTEVAVSDAPAAPKSAASPVTVVASASSVVATPVRADAGKDTALDQYLATGKPLPSYIKTSPTPAQTAPVPTSADTQQTAPIAATPTDMASTGNSADAAPSVVATIPDVAPPVPMPVAARPKLVPTPQRVVTEADLKGWKSGSLADYLRQRGLLSSDASDGSSN